MSEVFFTIDENSDGIIQLSINHKSGGYRICGPKYAGDSRTIRKHVLTKRDVEELRGYLSRVGEVKRP